MSNRDWAEMLAMLDGLRAAERADGAGAAYGRLMDMIGDRVRTCCWTPADAMACGAKLQERYLREYGRPMPA